MTRTTPADTTEAQYPSTETTLATRMRRTDGTTFTRDRPTRDRRHSRTLAVQDGAPATARRLGSDLFHSVGATGWVQVFGDGRDDVCIKFRESAGARDIAETVRRAKSAGGEVRIEAMDGGEYVAAVWVRL